MLGIDDPFFITAIIIYISMPPSLAGDGRCIRFFPCELVSIHHVLFFFLCTRIPGNTLDCYLLQNANFLGLGSGFPHLL